MTTVKYLSQIEAQELDKDLVSPEMGFVNDILMELAGKLDYSRSKTKD